MIPAPFPLVIWDNQSTAVDRGDISPFAYNLKFTTMIPGGCGLCSFRLNLPTRLVPDFLNFNYELRLGDNGDVFWIGRIEDIFAHRGPDGEYWDVTAYGYAVNLEDQVYTAQNVQNVVTSTVASNTLSNAPQIDGSTITASGFTISNVAAVNLKMLTMAQVVNWAAHFGLNATYAPFQWHVYPDSDATVRFTFENRPTSADYFLLAAECEVFEGGLVGRRLYDRVTVQYNDGASNVTVNDTALQAAGPDGWNLIRTLRQFVPEVNQSADATQIANALLTKYKQKRMAARSVRLKRGASLVDSNGQAVEPWRIRAGKLVYVSDLDPVEAASGALVWNNSFLIQETEWDQDTQELRITPEYRDLNPQEAFAYLMGVIGGHHTMQAR